MPSQSKTSWARLRVGLLCLAAMVILTVLVVLITGSFSFFQSNATVYTFMGDAAALSLGASVNLNGIPIGKVKAIGLSGEKDPQRLVRLTLEIPEKDLKSVPVDSICSISAANILGTKYINIKSGKSDTAIRPGAELPALNTAEFENVVQQGYAVLTSLQGTVERVDRIIGSIESGKGSIGKLLVDDTLYNHFLAIVDEVKQLADALNSDQGTFGRLIYSRELYDDFRKTMGRVDSLVQGLQEGQGTAGKLLKDPALFDEARKTTAELHKLVEDLNAGKGTAGKLLKSDDLHKQMTDLVAKVDLMLDKVNSGQGTLGQLMVNPQLYDNLAGATREMHLLMKDFRSNPKKFLRIKLAIF